MESLDRMRRLQALRPQRTQPEPLPPTGTALYAQARGGRARLEELVPGTLVETEAGACYAGLQLHAVNETRGRHALGALLELRPGCLAPFHPACPLDDALDFRDAVFLDTETTGLGTSASTYAFLVGVGTFERHADGAGLLHDRYVVRQFFMRSPAEEPALLTALAGLLRERTLIVTFNGRGFDLPLLRARYHYNRRYLPPHARDVPLLAENAAHLDLLQPARKLWRRRLRSCRLIHLEEHLLGATRSEEDVPGWLIPQLYIDYVRSGNAQPMRGVFYHNGEDILSTTALAAQAIVQVDGAQGGGAQGAGRGLGRGAQGVPLHGLDWLSLARSYEQAGRLDDAEAAYCRAVDDLSGSDLRETFACYCALLKRSRRWADAVAAWERWLTTVPGADATPYVELAKYYEWQARDLEQAEIWTAFGLHTLRATPAHQRLPGQLAELEHRLERIRRKRGGRAPGQEAHAAG